MRVGTEVDDVMVQTGPETVGRRAASLLRDNPEVVVAAVVGLVLLAAGLRLLGRYRRAEGERLVNVLADRDRIAVLMHPNPDPDAMATAMGVATLADQVDTDAVLQYSGEIRHQENRAFRTVLDLDLGEIEHVSDIAAEDVVLVDHNRPRGFDGSDAVMPLAVVDHHPGDGTGEVFTDVRTAYGAAASIVTEYFDDVGAEPVPPEQHASEVGAEYTVGSKVATGLLYGILTDTNDLTRGASAADFSAAGFLYPGVDEELLDRIANPAVGADVLETKARAIAGRQVRGSFAVSDVGTLSNPDALPQAADELVRLEGVTAVVVCGEVDGDVHLSGRSRDDRVHMGRIVEEVVDGWPGAEGGGHARMGGGQIPASAAAGAGPSGAGTAAEPDAANGGGTRETADGRVDRSTLVEDLLDALAGES